jgi:UDP-perosamine 4-acetyltransferase
MTAFLIWGAGGHGKVVADVVRASGGTVAGFVDSDPAKLGRLVEPGGGRVLMMEEEFLGRLDRLDRLPDGVDAVALAFGNNALRIESHRRLGAHRCPPLIHPRATVSESVMIGDGTVVLAGAVINPAARIGCAVIVNTGAIVEHDCVVEDGVHLAPRSVVGGGVRIGRGAWIGIGAIVIQQIAVGAETRVGAGAAVIHDVADGATVVGVPAKPIVPRSASAERS